VAKAKQADIIDFNKDAFKLFQKAQNKKWDNEYSVLTGEDDLPVIEVIPVGDPIWDRHMAGNSDVGGIIRGGIIEIAGDASSGKTTMALEYAAVFMKMFPTRAVALVDAEAAFDGVYAAHIGVPIGDPRFVYSRPKAGQEAVTVARDVINTGMFSLVIVDSWAALTPPRKADTDKIGNHSVGDHARLSGDALDALKGAAKQHDCTVIILNQERVNMTAMGARGKKTTGGNAMTFYPDMRISINKLKKDSDERRVTIVKSKCQALPWTEANITIRHGIGLDRTASVISLAIQEGLITTGGAGWMELNFFKGKKIQGMANMIDFLSDEPDARKDLCTALKIDDFEPRKPLVRKKIGVELSEIAPELAAPIDEVESLDE